MTCSSQVHPALAGVGYGSTVVATIVGCYYNVIIAWCIFYLGSSFMVSSLEYLGSPHTSLVFFSSSSNNFNFCKILKYLMK